MWIPLVVVIMRLIENTKQRMMNDKTGVNLVYLALILVILVVITCKYPNIDVSPTSNSSV